MKRNFAIAVKAVIYKENQVLLLKRSKEEVAQSRINKIDQWDLPGGGLQYFEKTSEGLTREIMEETGLQVEIIQPFDAHDIIRPHIHIVILTYLCEYRAGNVVLSEEHGAFEWITFEQSQQLPIQKWMKRIFDKANTTYLNYHKI